MLREVGGAGFTSVQDDADADDEEEGSDAADGDFDDERERVGFFGIGRTGFLGDLVEILEIVHIMIIPQSGYNYDMTWGGFW